MKPERTLIGEAAGITISIFILLLFFASNLFAPYQSSLISTAETLDKIEAIVYPSNIKITNIVPLSEDKYLIHYEIKGMLWWQKEARNKELEEAGLPFRFK